MQKQKKYVTAYNIEYDIDDGEIEECICDMLQYGPEKKRLAKLIGLSVQELDDLDVDDVIYKYVYKYIKSGKISITKDLFKLPTSKRIPIAHARDDSMIGDYISDATGFCILGFTLDTDE